MDPVRTLLLVICALLPALVIPASGAELHWSFKTHPWPADTQLSTAEMAYLDGPDDPELGGRCDNRILKRYKIYSQRYPAFSAHGSAAQRFLDWKIYMALRPKSYLNSCLITTAATKLILLHPSAEGSRFYYCGHFSRSPRGGTEQEAASLIDELMAYTRTGARAPADAVLFADKHSEWVRLDPALAYYLSKLVNPRLAAETPMPDTSALDQKLSPGRRAFLDTAAKAADLDAVLATIPACPAAK